jgi:cytochrome c
VQYDFAPVIRQGKPAVRQLIEDKHRMRTFACLSVTAAALALMILPAVAQTVPGDAQRGRELSERLCIACHKVSADSAGPVSTDVLSFPAIGNRPGATAEGLAGRVIFPHPAMPGVQLTVKELREIVTYILSLKRAN